jgi:stage II sporulation protein M
MKKQKQNYYTERIKFLKQSKNYLISVSIIFFLTALFGFFFPVFFTEQIIEMLKQLIQKFEGLNLFQTIVLIFLNNLWASFIMIVLGIFFGLLPIFSLILNGYLIGFVANEAVSQEGVLILWRLLPHGVFEIPAILISMALGIKIGFELFKKNPEKNLKINFQESIKIFFSIILPLLTIAAVIEGTLVFLFG